ncbi:MAG TPA: hypothetical protein VFB02_16630 [Bradyrhizobium sp.]|nr:hypothetical protein [Bradyrhizobium sp.]
MVRGTDKLSDHLAYPPRGMGVERAAAYVGFGVTKFLEMVDEGAMPKPVNISGNNPRWDRLDLDAAWDDLKDKGKPASAKQRSLIDEQLARLKKGKG